MADDPPETLTSNLAASTNSMTSMSMATALDNRYTRVESRMAMVKIRVGMDDPITDKIINAKIRVGKAMRMSMIRLNS